MSESEKKGRHGGARAGAGAKRLHDGRKTSVYLWAQAERAWRVAQRRSGQSAPQVLAEALLASARSHGATDAEIEAEPLPSRGHKPAEAQDEPAEPPRE